MANYAWDFIFMNNDNNAFYLFKIFLRFWLVKIPRIIHHNQLLLTKFGIILRYWTDESILQQNWQIIEPLTEKTSNELKLFW